MRILLDLGHPAHFHLFKNVVSQFRQAGHEIEILARQKDCLYALLEQAGWRYHAVSRGKGSLFGLGVQTLRAIRIARVLGKKKRFDLLLGTSLVVGPASRLTGGISLVFGEDDASCVPVFAKLAYPPAHFVVTPESLAFENHGNKHITYRGYQELAYLHPNRFSPNPAIRKMLGLGSNQRYFLIRLVSLTAHHDIGKRGISPAQAREIVTRLESHGKVFISAECELERDLRRYTFPLSPEYIFDAMACAEMVISDSQTMTAEAAVLGTPSLRCNSFVGRLAYLEELEHKYGLTVGIRPNDFDLLLRRMDEWLSTPEIKEQWRNKRDIMLSECEDLTQWIWDLLHHLHRHRNAGGFRRL